MGSKLFSTERGLNIDSDGHPGGRVEGERVSLSFGIFFWIFGGS